MDREKYRNLWSRHDSPRWLLFIKQNLKVIEIFHATISGKLFVPAYIEKHKLIQAKIWSSHSYWFIKTSRFGYPALLLGKSENFVGVDLCFYSVCLFASLLHKSPCCNFLLYKVIVSCTVSNKMWCYRLSVPCANSWFSACIYFCFHYVNLMLLMKTQRYENASRPL